jgi:hypothetical protein
VGQYVALNFDNAVNRINLFHGRRPCSRVITQKWIPWLYTSPLSKCLSVDADHQEIDEKSLRGDVQARRSNPKILFTETRGDNSVEAFPNDDRSLPALINGSRRCSDPSPGLPTKTIHHQNCWRGNPDPSASSAVGHH